MFIDEIGILRSRGRVAHCADLTYDNANPILLPKQSFLTELVIWDMHFRCKHLGTATTVNAIRTHGFWIPKGRSTVKQVLAKCIVCKKINNFAFKYPKPTDFISDKVNFRKPYQNTGIDYTGHLFVKINGKVEKMYMLIFTCLNVRSVHIELLPNMSCQQFLLAFTRFCNLYTIPDTIYSDNASTFLQALGIISNSKLNSDLDAYLARINIKHVKIPLYAAWIGAAWERMIRTIKASLHKAVGRKQLEYFQLITLLSDIENAINSRPLTYRDNDDHSYSVLTPNSFFKFDTGRSLVFGSISGSDIHAPTARNSLLP